jgi:pyruvate dehydrogenase E1 component beta subunit
MQHTFIEILRRALDEELARDPAVHLLGEDVAAGGAFGVTRGLAEKHGAKRVRNTPISEAAITGLATGAALCGLKPVLEIMFIDFATLSMDCLVNQTAKYRYMSGGQLAVPLVVRTQAGAAGGAAAQHSQSLEAWFIHVPGLIVVAPSTPAEAYGLLKSAIRLGEPVLFIEHKRLYTMKEELPEKADLPAIGKARIARSGTDVTVIAYSAMVQSALEAARLLEKEGISTEVIDLRTLLPLDMATVAASVSKTHRVLIAHEAVRSGGVGAEIAARIGEELFDELDAPVQRVGCAFVPIPFAPELERALLPGSADIVHAARELAEFAV